MPGLAAIVFRDRDTLSEQFAGVGVFIAHAHSMLYFRIAFSAVNRSDNDAGFVWVTTPVATLRSLPRALLRAAGEARPCAGSFSRAWAISQRPLVERPPKAVCYIRPGT